MGDSGSVLNVGEWCVIVRALKRGTFMYRHVYAYTDAVVAPGVHIHSHAESPIPPLPFFFPCFQRLVLSRRLGDTPEKGEGK